MTPNHGLMVDAHPDVRDGRCSDSKAVGRWKESVDRRILCRNHLIANAPGDRHQKSVFELAARNGLGFPELVDVMVQTDDALVERDWGSTWGVASVRMVLMDPWM